MDLSQYQESLRLITHSDQICLWDWDVPGECFDFSNLWVYLGVPSGPEKMPHRDLIVRIQPEDLAGLCQAAQGCISGGANTFTHEFRMLRPDGTTVWTQCKASVVQRGEEGRAVRIVGLLENVAHYKELVEQLRAKQRHLDIVAEISGQSYWEWSTREDRLVFSDHFFAEFGYRPGEVQQDLAGWFRLIHRDDRSRVSLALYDYLEGRAKTYNVDLRMRHHDGHYVWTTTSGQTVEWDDSGEPAFIVGGLLNIDKLKRTEEALQGTLRENKAYSQRLQQEIQVAEQNLQSRQGDIMRQDMLLRTVNSIATNLLSATKDTFAGAVRQALRALGEGVNADRAYVMDLVRHNGENAFRALYRWTKDEHVEKMRPKGDIFPAFLFGDWLEQLREGKFINVHISDIASPQKEFFTEAQVQSLLIVPIHLGGTFWGVIYYADSYKVRLSDEPELKTLQSGGIFIVLSILQRQANDRLVAAMEETQEAMRVKSRFLANMSHELHTPMNAILGMTAIAKDSPEKFEDCLDHITTASRHLLGIINDILEMSKIETNEFAVNLAPFSAQAMMTNVFNMHITAAMQKNQQLLVDLDPGLPDMLVGDELRLTQVLNNLMSNAVKFTPNDGHIRLSAALCAREGDACTLRFEVEDDGNGMSKEALDSLYTVFEQGSGELTRTHGGTGLGLALCRQLVERMGGQIEIDSQPGRGTRAGFVLRLAAQPQPEEAEEAEYDFTGKRILLAEDIEINSMIVQSMLEDTGVEIDCVENGELAVQAFAKDPARYDLIYMDLHMPITDGHEATRQIRALPAARAKQVPIVAMTANAFAEDVARCMEAGMDGHIAKPIEMDLLLETTEKFLAPKAVCHA